MVEFIKMEKQALKINTLGIKLENLQKEVGKNGDAMKKGFTRLEKVMVDTYVRKDVYEIDHKNLLKAVGGNTGDKRWVTQVIVNAIIVAVMSLIIIRASS